MKSTWNAKRAADLGVRTEDVEEQFTRSGGPGGQNVNKTSTAVILVHRPTGLQVRCETERSQGRNRERAWQQLLEKIAQQQRDQAAAEQSLREKFRRQNRRPSYRAKQRMLADKARRGEKKRFRQKAAFD